ncbi:hypothetical protein [Streptomyces albidus (ex Kaewkla and Franco 2022)]|uniref:hypothetical protein n=1 Tax=Streptomyces albidus (ex Kaewkla and Franco 2022) TaxID=722709 RepID=UPI0015EE57E1|nr:hypothetical protein [Streptomyces albidus (ex Kaewkla and Franco 2022)]
MRSRTVQALTVSGVVVIVAGAVFATTFGGPSSEGDYAPAHDRSSSGPDAAPVDDGTRAEGEYKAVIALPDDRKVEVRFVKRRGLGERHYDPRTKKWSKTNLIYRTKSDPCQGVRLSAAGGTVAATADFGLFCYDGEPPEKSIAAVGTGEFTEWEINRHDKTDGWEKVRIAKTGERVSFVRSTEELLVTLRWSRRDGYARPEEKPRPPTKLSEEFFGSWKAGDGSQRVVVQERGNGGVATFFSQNRERCVTRVGLIPTSQNVGQFIEVFRVKGDRSKRCPAYSGFEFLKLNKAGTELSFQESTRTFTKAEPNKEERELPSHPAPVFSVDRDWLGGWELEDGSRRVTIAEPEPGKPTVTFTGPGSCVARAEVSGSNDGQDFSIVATRPAKRIKGKPTANCPPKLGDFTLSGDGKTFTQRIAGKDLTRVRSAAAED